MRARRDHIRAARLPLFWLFIVTPGIRTFGVEGVNHRYFSHRAYKANRVVQFILALVAPQAGQRGSLWWAGKHRDHHKYVETARGPHSPVAHSNQSVNRLFLALLTMGAGWHNNHHRHASSARAGFAWYEVDLTYYILVLLQRLRLVSGVKGAIPDDVLVEGGLKAATRRRQVD